jgi:hypothetical protein
MSKLNILFQIRKVDRYRIVRSLTLLIFICQPFHSLKRPIHAAKAFITHQTKLCSGQSYINQKDIKMRKEKLFFAIALIMVASNIWSMELDPLELGLRISKIFESYKDRPDSGLITYVLRKDPALVIESIWKNKAAVYQFFRSQEHKELKAIFSGSGIAQPKNEVENPNQEVKVTNMFIDGVFYLRMVNVNYAK